MKTEEILVEFPGGPKRVDTHVRGYTVKTDSSVEGGGEGLAPSPLAVFLAGLAACTASTARGYCRNHGLPIPKRMKATVHYSEDGSVVERIEYELIAPPGFPPDHLEALKRAAAACDVKRVWQRPPEFSGSARIEEE